MSQTRVSESRAPNKIKLFAESRALKFESKSVATAKQTLVDVQKLITRLQNRELQTVVTGSNSLALGFLNSGVSGLDLMEMLKSRSRIFKQGSRGLAVSNLYHSLPLINRGYYTVARRYEFCVRVAETISFFKGGTGVFSLRVIG